MTERKRWPNHAEDARLEALAEATRGLQNIRPILAAEQSQDTTRRAAIAVDAFYRIIMELQAVGPQTEIPGAAAQQPGKGTQVPHSFYQKRTQEP